MTWDHDGWKGVRDMLAGAEQRREGPAREDDPAALLATQVRQQCAEQVLADIAAAGTGYDLTERLHARVNAWTEAAARTPEEEGT